MNNDSRILEQEVERKIWEAVVSGQVRGGKRWIGLVSGRSFAARCSLLAAGAEQRVDTGVAGPSE